MKPFEIMSLKYLPSWNVTIVFRSNFKYCELIYLFIYLVYFPVMQTVKTCLKELNIHKSEWDCFCEYEGGKSCRLLTVVFSRQWSRWWCWVSKLELDLLTKACSSSEDCEHREGEGLSILFANKGNFNYTQRSWLFSEIKWQH